MDAKLLLIFNLRNHSGQLLAIIYERIHISHPMRSPSLLDFSENLGAIWENSNVKIFVNFA